MGALSVGVWGRHRNLILSKASGRPKREMDIPQEGDTAKGKKGPGTALGGGKGETGPMLGGEGVISQRMERGVMAKQPETSYCWGPISQWERGRGTPWGSPKLHI